MSGENGKSTRLYEIVISFLLGVLLTGVAAYVSAQKDVITRREFQEYQAQVNARQTKNEEQLDRAIQAIAQNASDTARIMGELGVTGHPIGPR